MIEALLSTGAVGGQVGVGYRPAPAIYRRAISCGSPLPVIGAAGTGGLEGEHYYSLRMGYRPFEVVLVVKQPEQAPFVKLMQVVKIGFGRTMTRLPEVFGVSRQALYNWLDGETPKEAHHAKLRQLAAAAHVFTELGFKPTSLALDRTVSQGKSLLKLLSEGADGREMAEKLVRIDRRGAASRVKLDTLLDGRRARPEASDLGTPSFDERA